MSWFPAPLPTSSGGSPDQRSWQLVPFYKGLVDLPQETLLASWSGEPRLQDSRFGSVTGAAEFHGYVTASREWLALSDATHHPLRLVATATRSVEEVVLQLQVGGERQEQGAAVVAEWDDGHRLTAVRVYHTAWPLPSHRVHLPRPTGSQPVALPAFVRDLQLARGSRDLKAVLGCYERDAELCLFDAVPQLFSGRDQLRRLYTVPGVPGSTARTTIGAVTDDGRTCAVEYEAGRGGDPAPDEVGVTTYERGPHGRIARERRYRVSASARFGPAPVADLAEAALRPPPGRASRVGSGAAR